MEWFTEKVVCSLPFGRRSEILSTEIPIECLDLVFALWSTC